MAYSLVASVTKAGSGNSAGIDTTGSSLLVLFLASQTVGTGSTRTDLDSRGNTWTRIGSILTNVNAFSMQSALYYVENPSVGSGHTFTSGGETAPALGVLAFSGGLTSGALDRNSEAADDPNPSQAGSITPSQNDEVLILGNGGFWTSASLSVDGGFTATEVVGAGGTNYALGISYLIQTTAAAANPSASVSSSWSNLNCHLASFKAAGGGGGTTWPGYQSPFGWR